MPYIGKIPATQGKDAGPALKLDDISGDFDGLTSTFSLSVDGTSISPHVNNISVYLSGVYQIPGNSYSLSGSYIVFTGAPSASLYFHGAIIGAERIFLPDNATVETSAFTTDTITSISGSRDAVSISGSRDAASISGSFGNQRVGTTDNVQFANVSSSYISTGSFGNIAIGTNSGSTLVTTRAGNVGIGTANNLSTLTQADDLTIGNTTGAHGMSIISQGNTSSSIFFGEAVGTVTGRIEYDNNIQDMFITAGSAKRMTINSTGVGIGTTAPGADLPVASTTEYIFGIENNDTNNEPASMRFIKKGGDPDTNDQIGQIEFYGENASNETEERARISVVQRSIVNGSEDAIMSFNVSDGGTVGTRMAISGSYIGIGTTDPTDMLTIDHTADPAIVIKRTNASTQINKIGTDSAGFDFHSFGHATGTNNQIRFFTTGSNSATTARERIRIHHNGAVVFNGGDAYDGTTLDFSPGVVVNGSYPALGLRADANDFLSMFTTAGGPVTFLFDHEASFRIQTATNAGGTSAATKFSLDNTGILTLVGPNSRFTLNGADGGQMQFNGTNRIRFDNLDIHPNNDNEVDLGDSSLAWKDIYYEGSITDTSDERFKENIEDTDLGLDFITDLRPVMFNKIDDKFLSEVVRDEDGKIVVDENDEQVTEKIANPDYDESRKRYGVIAQEVIEVLKKHDKDGKFWGIDTSDEDRYHADYIQFIAPLIKAVQELSTEVTELKKEIEELKK